MNYKHQNFINEYLSHGDKYKAYQTVYPKASGRALKVSADRLFKKEEIQLQISEVQKEANALVVKQFQTYTINSNTQKLSTLQQKRQILARMINGEYTVKRYLNLRNHIELVEEELNPYALLRAIELDCKLEQQQNELLQQKEEPEAESITTNQDRTKKLIQTVQSMSKRGMAIACKTEIQTLKELQEEIQTTIEEGELAIEEQQRKLDSTNYESHTNDYPKTQPVNSADTTNNWLTYLKHDQNTANLPHDLKAQKEHWFKNKTEKQQLKLIQLHEHKKAG